ncbi:hypothetical protein Q8W40_24960 [Vibrio penaeicida]|uniref:hypothetical protein n=1 Tax=Vibrio penaeicida TaxID=104609 RepID=UPI002734B39D|nr:hypothetical protein [Vibrio penaeicida]MDP2575469.1 hypothetical protein [Vibrio penaeicida]
MRLLIIFFVSILILACEGNSDHEPKDDSTDPVKLGKLINFNGFQPVSVNWITGKRKASPDGLIPSENQWWLFAVIKFDSLPADLNNCPILEGVDLPNDKHVILTKMLDDLELSLSSKLSKHEACFFFKDPLIDGAYLIDWQNNLVILDISTF